MEFLKVLKLQALVILLFTFSADVFEAIEEPMFQEPSLARARFLEGKRLPEICSNNTGTLHDDEANESFSLEADHQSLLDASTLVGALYKTVKSDLFLTQSNIKRSWVKKLNTSDYQWKQSILPYDLSTALRRKTKFSSCAVVGSSGHLRRTNFGPTIDSFSAVARANQAPTKGYESHSGSHTTLRFVNEALARFYRYSSLKVLNEIVSICRANDTAEKAHSADKGPTGHPQALRDDAIGSEPPAGARRLLDQETGGQHRFQIRAYSKPKAKKPPQVCKEGKLEKIREGRYDRDSIQYRDWTLPLEQRVIMAQVSESKTLPWSHKQLRQGLKLLRPDTKLLLVPNTVTHMVHNIMRNWSKRLACRKLLDTQGECRPTTGVQMVMVMLGLCNRVVLYGFGPSMHGQENASYHFFEGHGARTWKTSSTRVHNFRSEFLFLKSLESKGLLTICNEASAPDCGRADIEAGNTHSPQPLKRAPKFEPKATSWHSQPQARAEGGSISVVDKMQGELEAASGFAFADEHRRI